LELLFNLESRCQRCRTRHQKEETVQRACATVRRLQQLQLRILLKTTTDARAAATTAKVRLQAQQQQQLLLLLPPLRLHLLLPLLLLLLLPKMMATLHRRTQLHA
jgi:hypothetical protein